MTSRAVDAPARVVRIGVLGAARIAPYALIQPARDIASVSVDAVAARSHERAREFGTRHGVARAYASYADLLADPEIDAIYNPLPNGLHGRWTIAALEAGKHVLCEKPFTANAEEAEAVAQVARRTGLVAMEAFHYRYHGMMRRMLEIVASGELGRVRHVEAWLCIPLPFKDIRWELALAGGALMDAGCYPVHMVRTLAGAEPVVRAARAKLRSVGVDRVLQADFDFADGRTGAITASMWSTRLFSVGAKVVGDDAVLEAVNPLAPQYMHGITIRAGRRIVRKEQVAKMPSSYAAQLQSFADAVLHGATYPTNVDDAIANMRVIDACYVAAGLAPRTPTRG